VTHRVSGTGPKSPLPERVLESSPAREKALEGVREASRKRQEQSKP